MINLLGSLGLSLLSKSVKIFNNEKVRDEK